MMLRPLKQEDPDELIALARAEHEPVATWCLFSGGNDSTVLAHRREHALPESPAAALLHRSGECNCGAFAKASQERAMLQALYPTGVAAARLSSVVATARAEDGR
jgi:hypothetical protein